MFTLSGKPPHTATITFTDADKKKVGSLTLTGNLEALIALQGTPLPAPVPVPPVPPAQPGGTLFVPRTQLSQWLEQNGNHPSAGLLRTKIESKPTAIWLLGNATDANVVQGTLKNCGNTIPMFVLYAIPDRDAQQHSAGGFKTVDEYNKWVGGIGWAVEQAGNKSCIFIVEPDALGLLNDKPTTYPCINAAVDILRKNSNTKIFIDAPMWVDANDMAGRVKGAGVHRAHGISVNVSGHVPTARCEGYAESVLGSLNVGMQYIVDTSRNGGTVKEGAWCNPDGAKIGALPKLFSGEQAYAYVWVKVPGESDGECNGGPKAGQLWIERAVSLAG